MDEMETEEKRKIADRMLVEFKNDHICFMTTEGMMTTSIDEFISQDVEGILYDLNRGEIITLTLMPDDRWVNDIATACVIRALKAKIDELKEDNHE